MDDVKLWEQAIRHRDEGRMAEAQRLLERLISSGQQPPAVHAVLGYLYWEQGQLDNAISSFQKAVSLAPRSEDASLALFHCLWEKNATDEALSEARRFLSLSHSDEYQELLSSLFQD
jgi:tetratricopeptide (TPR) repeat protein